MAANDQTRRNEEQEMDDLSKGQSTERRESSIHENNETVFDDGRSFHSGIFRTPRTRSYSIPWYHILLSLSIVALILSLSSLIYSAVHLTRSLDAIQMVNEDLSAVSPDSVI